MDITYFVALAIAIVVGLVAALIFVMRGGISKRSLITWATLASVVLDFTLLIDWAYVSDYPFAVIGLDLLFFTIYGLVGCTLGALTVLAVRRALRTRA